MKNITVIIVLLFALTININAQTEKQPWAAGISIAGAKYSFEAAKVVGGQLAHQTPRFNVSKYIYKGLIADAAIATSIADHQSYTTFDATLRYDFGTSNDKVVPYILVGGSFISAIRTTPTANFGAGSTFWFNQKYGLNFQLMYKFSESKFESQKSHLYPSVGLVYSFGYRSLNPRIWND
ncbi:hypothetical protein [Polaribacter sp. OB-PA-B3]